MALALANCNLHVAEAHVSRPHPPTPSVLCTASEAREEIVEKSLHFPFGMRARVPSAFYVSRANLPHGNSYVSQLLPALFLPRAPRFQAAFSREILHMQAGQYVNQMGTDFYEVLCNEHGIGGEGEYCGDNDAQLGRINLPRGLGRKVRTTRGVLRPRARRGRRCARVAGRRALQPGKPREQKRVRGKQLSQGPLHKSWPRILLNPPVL